MILAEVKCKKCGTIFEVSKNTMVEDFPTDEPCPECGNTESKRIYHLNDFAIGIGVCGNSETGYGHEFIKRPGKFGYFKGTKIAKK